MTRLPRDIGSAQLIRALRKLGYEQIRQTGSHIRLVTSRQGEHHITVPKHSPLKVGTLDVTLKLVGEHFQLTRDELLELLFG